MKMQKKNFEKKMWFNYGKILSEYIFIKILEIIN